MLLHFFLSWLLYDFFCLCLSHSLFLVFAYLSHPLPGSEPGSRAKMEELKKSGLSVRAGGLKDHPNGPSAPPCLALRLSPKTEHLPPLQPPPAAKPREDGGSHCAGMALLLWKPVLRNSSEQIHWGGARPWGRGKGQTAPWTLPSHYPPCDSGQVT